MASPEISDLIVVGAGPAGLQAAVFAESEGLDTLVLDSGIQIGGQAGTSQWVENDGAFPNGISGRDMMGRMADTAIKFHADFRGPTRVREIEPIDEGMAVRTDDGDEYLGRVVLLSTGVEVTHLNARNMAAFVGRGVNYAPPPRSVDYKEKVIVVIGGANSAGQSAETFSQFEACKVYLVVRGETIGKSMSQYLVDKIKAADNIEVMTETELIGVDGSKGSKGLSSVTLQTKGKKPHKMAANEVFVYIGAKPRTIWLPEQVFRDPKDFVVAGSDLPEDTRQAFAELTKGRLPYGHETSMPGVFVAGDVRSGTIKRIVAAKGDGASAIAEIHKYRAQRYESNAH